MSAPAVGIRQVAAHEDALLHEIAARMRLTLIEVVGEEEGGSMYSMEWLQDRVRYHLDPEQCTAVVLVAEDADGQAFGHIIARVEVDEDGSVPGSDPAYGLVSTIYVGPEARREGIAEQLVAAAEDWMRKQRMPVSATNTGKANEPLIRLFEKRGYQITWRTADMVQLTRPLR